MATLRITQTPTPSNPTAGDLWLDDSGQLEWVGMDITDAEDYSRAILQSIRTRLLIVRGEWYLDQRIGTPWREKVWHKGATSEVIHAIARLVIAGTPGVESIQSLRVSLDSAERSATITTTVVSDLGTIVSTDSLDKPLLVEIPHG